MEHKTLFLKQVEGRLENSEFPQQVTIETTACCNLECIMCRHSKMKRKKGNMDIKLYKKIIDEIADNNPFAEIWLSFYGEPLLLRYKLYYMIKYAKQKGLKNIMLNTNGMLCDDEMQDLLIESGIDKIDISVDGFFSDTYETIRKNANRDILYKNILSLISKVSSNDKPYIEVQFIVMDENKNELNDFISFWRKQNVYIKIREKASWAGTIEAHNLSKDIDRIACPMAISNCAITWSGEMVACCVDYDGEVILGDINKRKIKDIWNNEHKKFAIEHLNHNFNELPQLCQKCFDWQTVGAESFTRDLENRVYWKEKFKNDK